MSISILLSEERMINAVILSKTINIFGEWLCVSYNLIKMVDGYNDVDISVFKDALMDENTSVCRTISVKILVEKSFQIQVDAIRRLPALAGAMEEVRVREELIPFLVNCLDSLPAESCYNLAEQLERLVPLIIGCEHVGAILDILLKLVSEDETTVRKRAVEAMNTICSHLSNEQCEQFFYPIFENLTNSDWFASKCSAGCLISVSHFSHRMPYYLSFHADLLFKDAGRKANRTTKPFSKPHPR